MEKFKCPFCGCENYNIIEIYENNITKVRCLICNTDHEIKTKSDKLQNHHRDN